jgi:hypothetical protein
VIASSAVARAESVAVLEAIIDGVPPEARTQLEASLEEGLKGAGFTVVPREVVKDKLVKKEATEGCSFGPCLRAVGKALGVELVLVARITAEGPSFTFVLTLVDTTTGAPVAQVADTCAVCTFDEAMSAATLAVVDLGSRYRSAQDEAAAVPPARAPRKQRTVRNTGWWLAGVAALAGGAATYMLSSRDDMDEWGYGAAGAGGALGVTGAVLLIVGD